MEEADFIKLLPPLASFVTGAVHGTVSTPAKAGGNLLHDSTKHWAVDAHKSRLVKVTNPDGTEQVGVISTNAESTLLVHAPWYRDVPAGATYSILAVHDVARILRDVLGGGSDISAVNPLETHDPNIEDIEDKLDHPSHGLAALAAAIAGIAGGAFYGSYGPRNIEVDNDVDFGQILYDPAGNIITTGEITPGTYTVHRVRGAVDTEIVASAASSEAAGRVYMTYNFPAASWNVGDIFYVTFSGIVVTLDGLATEYPNLYIWGRVVREADISSKVDAIETKLDTPANFMADVSALALETSLGTHDTDIKALLAVIAGYGLSFLGTVTTATSDVQFSASALAGFGNGYFKGYYVYPVWDAGGAGAAPQGEHKLIATYTSVGGVFTHAAFTADLVLTDKVLIVHPSVARILDNYALLINATYGLSALQALVGAINAVTTDSLHGKLGTDTELADYSLYDLLGGNAFKTHSLSAMLGALTATNNLKGILGAYTTAANLKAAIDAIPTTAMRGTDSAALASAWTAALAGVLANYTAIRAGYLDELAAANLPTTTDNILLDTQIKKVASGTSGVIGTGASKYIEVDSGTNSVEILAVIINGVVGFDWTLDIYVPTADAVAAPAAADKRDTIAYVNTDTEGGLLKPFGIAYNAFLKFTNDSGGNQTVNDVVVVYRSRGAVTIGGWT